MSSYEKSIPDRCETWAATQATYRFLDNAGVSHSALQQIHWTYVMQEALAPSLYDELCLELKFTGTGEQVWDGEEKRNGMSWMMQSIS